MGFRNINDKLSSANITIADASGGTLTHNFTDNSIFTDNTTNTFVSNSNAEFSFTYNFNDTDGTTRRPINRVQILFFRHADNFSISGSSDGINFDSSLLSNSNNEQAISNGEVINTSQVAGGVLTTYQFDLTTLPQINNKKNPLFYKSIQIQFNSGFQSNIATVFKQITFFEEDDYYLSNRSLDYNFEFNDSLLSYQGYINPRHYGSKLTAKKINKYVSPLLNPAIKTGQYNNDPHLTRPVGQNINDIRQEQGWGGDTSYGKNPLIESKIKAIFVGKTITDGFEDTSIVRIEGHSYITIDKILLINTETDDIEILTLENTNEQSFKNYIVQNFNEGDEVNFKLYSYTEGFVLSQKLKGSHNVKMNEGMLMRLYTYTPYTETDQVTLTGNFGTTDGVVGGFGEKHHSDITSESPVAGFGNNFASGSNGPGGGLFSFGMSLSESSSLYNTESIDFVNELPEELITYENDINLSIAGEILTIVSNSYTAPQLEEIPSQDSK